MENGFPTFEWIRQQNPQLEHAKKGERLWDILNRARNFFKREGKTLTETIDFTDEMNDLMLVMACNDSMNLTIKNSLFEVDAYIAWYLAVHTDIDKAIANTRDQVKKNKYRSIREQFPRVKTLSRGKQKLAGEQYLQPRGYFKSM
jgi:hypothetical protein